MTHTVLRGKPTAAQLYLDGILNEVLVCRGEIPDAERREKVSLPQILFHCLAKNLEDVFMINGETGETITNAEILKQAISLAHMLESKDLRGKVALVVMFSDQTFMAVYLALLFAGVVPFITLPRNTVYEISYFLKLIEPSIVHCDERYYEVLKTALESVPELEPDIMLPHTLPEPQVELDISSFQIPDAGVDNTVIMVPTSGSTGLPKACLLTHRGLVAKLPAAWYRNTTFPRPTALVLLTGLPEGVLFQRMISSCVVFSVPVLLPYNCRSEEWLKTALLNYRPTWVQFASFLAKQLVTSITADHLSSLQCFKLGGSQPCKRTTAGFMKLLPKSAVLEVTYGLSETHSVVATGENEEPLRMTNIFEYKLVDGDGNTLGLPATGELCLKGPALAKGYYRNNAEFLEHGWYKTGDLFYIDEKERLFFQARKNSNFKAMHAAALVSPEEVESVIGDIPGVSACVVCLTERGAAAAVVARGVTREHVNKAVKDALNSYKHLHAGVGFVPTLPVLHAGKLDRLQCDKLVRHLVATGECY